MKQQLLILKLKTEAQVSMKPSQCCKKQMTSTDGTEHDQKCNLFKAQQMLHSKQGGETQLPAASCQVRNAIRLKLFHPP